MGRNLDFKLDIPKSDKLNKYLPKNYLLIHYKKKVSDKLRWGVKELDLILDELKKYNLNIVLIKDIEKDETNLIYRKKYKTFDFESNMFYDNKSNVLFLDNIEGEDLYNVIKYSNKVIAFHGTITSIAFLNKISRTPVALKLGCADQKAAAAPAAFGVEQLVPVNPPPYA